MAYLNDLWTDGPDVVLAHCIHLTDTERQILCESQTAIAHCPGSNFMLGAESRQRQSTRDRAESLSAPTGAVQQSHGRLCRMRLAASCRSQG